jgi:hypothetical protein
MNIAQTPVTVGELAEQQRAPVAQLRHVSAELVSRVGLGDRGGAAGNQIADQKTQPVRTCEPGSVETQLAGQRCIEGQQPQVGKRLRLPTDSHLRQVAGEAVLQSNGGIRCDAHSPSLRRVRTVSCVPPQPA